MQDRVGQVWEWTKPYAAQLGVPRAAVMLIVRSDLEECMHRMLVLDPGDYSYKQGQLRTHGEVVEAFGWKRIA